MFASKRRAANGILQNPVCEIQSHFAYVFFWTGGGVMIYLNHGICFIFSFVQDRDFFLFLNKAHPLFSATVQSIFCEDLFVHDQIKALFSFTYADYMEIKSSIIE